MSHSHQHSASLDTTDERGIRALKISLAGLLATAILQGVIALAGGSAGLMADTLHNLADAFAALPLWVAFNLARRAANRRFTYGYGRAEDLAGLLVLLFVIGSAALAGYESYTKLLSRQQPTLIGLGIAAGLIGMIGNEIVARYKMKIGREIGSAALIAEGQHSRIDGLTSLAVVLGLAGVAAGLPWADAAAGLLITAAILFIVVEVGREILARLMDAIEPETVDEMERLAGAVPGVQAVHATRARWLGHEIEMEMHIAVDGALDLVQAHAIAEAVRHDLLHHIPRLSDVVVHVDPVEAFENMYHTTTAHHFTADAAGHEHEHSDEPHTHS